MTGKLTVGPDGRIRGPASIKYNDPFPCVNGRYGSGRMTGVLMHTMVSELPSAVSWFNNPQSQASAHFCVAESGEIWQMGPIGKGWIAWHAAEGNATWYGIEHADAGNPARPLTQAQITASAQLVECLSAFAGFPLQVSDSPSVKGYGWHGMGGAAFGGHFGCPGDVRKAQRPAIIALARQIRAGDSTPAVKTWTAKGMLSLAALSAQHLHEPAASVLATTCQHSPGKAFAADLAGHVNAVFAGDSEHCPAGITWYYPNGHGVNEWVTKGMLSLAALASEIGTTPAAMLASTAARGAGGQFRSDTAAYINAVFGRSPIHVPAGTVIYY